MIPTNNLIIWDITIPWIVLSSLVEIKYPIDWPDISAIGIKTIILWLLNIFVSFAKGKLVFKSVAILFLISLIDGINYELIEWIVLDI